MCVVASVKILPVRRSARRKAGGCSRRFAGGGQFHAFGGQIIVGDQTEQVGDAVQAGLDLDIGVDHIPGGLFDVGVLHHDVFGLGIFHPAAARFHVHRAELPALGRVFHPVEEALLLFGVADREPVLNQDDTGADQHALKFGAGTHEFPVFLVSAEAHDVLHAGPVVPAPVKEDHLTGSGEVGDVTLEVPLGLFAFGGGRRGRPRGQSGG